MFEEPRRARRIRLTLRIAANRRRQHLARIHGDPTGANVDCVCELAATYFAKRKGAGCSCRKRRKGRPKLTSGLCKMEMRVRIYRMRRVARRLGEFSRGRVLDWEDDDAVLLAEASVR